MFTILFTLPVCPDVVEQILTTVVNLFVILCPNNLLSWIGLIF